MNIILKKHYGLRAYESFIEILVRLGYWYYFCVVLIIKFFKNIWA
jgi:hypothetical protein